MTTSGSGSAGLPLLVQVKQIFQLNPSKTKVFKLKTAFNRATNTID